MPTDTATDPSHPLVAELHTLLAEQRLDEAAARAERALAENPNEPAAHGALAAVAYARGDFKEVARRLVPLRAAGATDPACLLARSLYAAGRPRELAGLAPAPEAAQRHNEAVLVALAAWRHNDLQTAERALAVAEAAAPEAAQGRGVPVFATQAGLLRTLMQRRGETPELYRGEVAHLFGAIGDVHVASAGHLVVPWQGANALLMPEPLLDAAPSILLAEPPAQQTLRAAFAAALDRLPAGSQPLVCFGEIDLRLTQGLFSRSHAMTEAALLERLRDLARDLAEFVAAEGRARGMQPILVTPPASNAPLSLVGEDVRQRFRAAHKRFVGALRQAAERLALPLVDLRAATESGGKVQGHLYFDTNHLRPEAWHRAFDRHVVLPETATP